jgi:hypothetical protein
MGFNSVQLGMRETWDLTMSNWVWERHGIYSAQLGIREAWDLTVSNWV